MTNDYCMGAICERFYPHSPALHGPDTGEPSTARLPQEPTPQLAESVLGRALQQASAPLPRAR